MGTIFIHLTFWQGLVALAFIMAVVGIFTASAVIVAAWLIRLIRRRPAPKRRPWWRWARGIVLVLASVGVMCILWGYFVEPYWPEVTHVTLTTDKLPPGTRPIRIVQISDTHCDAKVRLEDELPDLIAAERPDAIIFTGDAVNSLAGLENFRTLMQRLVAIAPTFAVAGNFEGLADRQNALYTGTGVTLLDRTARPLTVDGATIWICGVGISRYIRDIPQTLAMAPKGAYRILLFHTPGGVMAAAEGGADLYLAGHTHGGQVALPWYGALVTLSRYGKQFESGLYRVGDMWAYVNRGIGMENDPAPRVRFCARPEITVFTIAPEMN